MLRGVWKAFNNARAVVLAVVVHVLAIGILVVNMEWFDVKPAGTPKAAPIKTQTVDRKLIEQELARVEQEKKARQAEEKRRQEKLKQEKERLAKLEQKRKQEEQRLKELEARRKKEAEAKRKKELALKKKRETEAKKKAEAEAKRKQELALKKKREAEAKKKAEAEARRKKAAAEKQRVAAEKARLQKEREQAMMMAIQAEENQSRIAQITGMIRADVQNNWRIPPTARKGMQCKMRIRLFPSGEVQEVQIIEPSGDLAFDRSAEEAVLRASPLPVSVSSAGELFNSNFREFNFLFNPRNI